MYTYKSEILWVSSKWFSDKANEKAAEGWELVTYDYMATSLQARGAFVVTFRKAK